jgi:hypothetical protein
MNDENTASTAALRRAERNLASTDPVRGRDVQIDKLYRARCHRCGCGWTGGEHANYQDASAERHTHLRQHILAAGDAL